MQTPTISLVMIVKNEARIIRRALLSALPHIDHWVICDTGSTDGTQDIIRETLKDIPGTLHEVPWVSFGHNRDQVMSLGRPTADYLLMLDADMALHVSGPFKDKLTADAYDLRYQGGLDYVQTFLTSTRHEWHYIGVTHEYVMSPTCHTTSEIPEVTLIDYGDGGNKSDKFERDVRLLTEALEKNPNNARDVFYLAQSYKDLGNHGAALYWYDKRSKMAGWIEETWYAKFMFAVMQEKIGIKWPQVQESYLASFAMRPCRLEPIYMIVEHYRSSGQFALGYLFGTVWGVGFPYPKDRLFINRPVYDFLLPYAYGLCANNLGYDAEATRAFDHVLSQTGVPQVYLTDIDRMRPPAALPPPPEEPKPERIMKVDRIGSDYHLVIVRPNESYPHSSCFKETAEALRESMETLGYKATLYENCLDALSVNIIYGVHLLSEQEAFSLPENTIIYNMEQLGGSWTPEWYMDLAKRYQIWDYSPINLQKWNQMERKFAPILVEVGFSPVLTRIPDATEEDIDVLFYGAISWRRHDLLQALGAAGLNVKTLSGVYGAERDAWIARSKVVLNLHATPTEVFEVVRVSYLLANHKAVVSEMAPDMGELEAAVVAVPFGQLVDACVKLVNDSVYRASQSVIGYNIFTQRKQEDLLAKALGLKRPMKIAALSVVKDECDIIEYFVRLDARFIDHHYIVDDGSSDATLEVLTRLEKEGLPITVHSVTSVDHRQRYQSTRVMHEIARDTKYDWWVLLDADEFIQGDRTSLEDDLRKVPENTCAAMRWQTYVPFHAGPDWDLYTNFVPRSHEPNPMAKVIVPGSIAGLACLDPGHHSASIDGRSLSKVTLATRLSHVPVRSSEQIVSKAILGSHKLSLTADRVPGEGFHWDDMAEVIRKANYQLTLEQLQDLAYGYSQPRDLPLVRGYLDVPRIGANENRVRYGHLRTIPLHRRLDDHIGLLCAEIRMSRYSSELT